MGLEYGQERASRVSDRTLREKVGAIGLVIAGFIGGVVYNATQDSNPDKVSINDGIDIIASAGLSGAFILDGLDCPEGDIKVPEGIEVVQDYVADGSGEDGRGKLIAVRPEKAYQTIGTIAFCGPDFGSNGARFDGEGIVIFGDSTIIDKTG